MGNELIIALLAIGFVGSLAASFVMWSFYDGQKKLTQEECEKRWDEISLRLNVEKELEKEQRLGAEREEEIFRLSVWHNIMQDKLSAILCPTNNHVWRDGCCVKCGRIQDGTSDSAGGAR